MKELPPKVLRFDIDLSEHLPTLARIQVQADDGIHSFLAHRELLEDIARVCLNVAAQLLKPSNLS